jgi:membrane fusion protein, multidrug efflux system
MIPLIKNSAPALLGAIVLVSVVSSCGNKSKNNGQEDQTKVYQVLTLEPQNITINTDYPATIEGRQNVEIRPKVDGYIEAIYVDEGATVKKGQLLFRISNPEYTEAVRNAEAAIGSADAAVATAQLEVEKVKPLVEKEIVSQYQLKSAKLDLKSKKAAFVQAKANLANARANLNYCKILSPANGSIGLIPYKIGALVSSTSTEPLTTVSDISSIYAYFSFTEKQMLDFSRNLTGKTLNEKIKSLGAISLLLSDGSVYEKKGKIEMVSGQIDTNTGSSTVRASFSNPSGLIRSGGSATVRIPKQYQSVIVIPQSATTELQNVRFAYVAGSDNKIKSAVIKTVASSDGQFYVVTEGLKAGDRIILDGVSLLKEGQFIKAKAVNNASIYKTIN